MLYEKNNVLFDLLNKSVVTDRLRERAVELGFNNCIFYLVLMDTNNRFLEDHHRFFLVALLKRILVVHAFT